MKKKILPLLAAFGAMLPAAAIAAPLLLMAPDRSAAATVPNPDAVSSARIRDLSARLVVTQANFDELAKIGGSFKTSYRFKEMSILYKSPNKTRLEAKVLGTSVMFVYNGSTRMVKVPFRKDVRDLSGQPGQKENLLHLGIFAKDYLATDWQPAFARRDGALQVYRLTQRGTDNKSYEIVWVNPRTAVIERRQSFDGKNRLRMETRYKNIVQAAPGAWVPTRIEVYNQFGKLGGTQQMRDLKVNAGVSDDNFATS